MNDIKITKNQGDAQSLAAQSAESSEAAQVPEWLGSQLKHLFTEVMAEPIPEDLRALLKQLEEKERR